MTETITPQQRKALHVYCRLLSDGLTDAGYSIQEVLSQAVARDWNQEAVKELLFKPIMEAMTGKTSTEKLTSSEVSEVYEVLNRHTSDKFGVGMEFPHDEARHGE